MKRQVPTERELTDMIAMAFERLPVPDSRRLAAIEQRLLAQVQPRRRAITWWWLAVALAAGAASALWWAVDYDSGKEQKTPLPTAAPPSLAPSVPDQPAVPGRRGGAESKPAGEPRQKQGPMIYRQER